MAAYAALVSLSQTIQHILQHGDDDDQCSILLRSLHDHVVFLQSFLEQKIANDLEGRISGIANETEDIIEYFILNQIQTVKSSHGIAIPVQYDIKKLHKKLQRVRHVIDSIVGQVTAIENSSSSTDVQLTSDSTTASSLSIQVPRCTNKDSMVGFDKSLIKIKAQLCSESLKLQVIPIFGMGGIGKTTLARNAYNDPLSMDHFDIRAWVTISQDYSVKRIVSELLDSLRTLGEEESYKRNETLDVMVYKRLKGRRYLVVMDDVWSTNVWDDLMRLLPNDDNGSRIMLTTRLSDVAGYAGDSSRLHEVQLMDVDQSWHLLSQNVFKQEQCPHELEDIGRMIARSCRGLPLAIVVIAGVLKMVSQTRASWENVAENVNLAVATNEEQFANILYLSYTHLPHHLRPCFLYMGGFPEDYEIHVSKLIKLWIAEGFIQSSGSKSYEESAEEYLEDLVKRSLILVTKTKSNGKIKSCNVHDLVRDLCIRKAQEENFFLNLLVSDVNRTHDQRRVSTRNIWGLSYYDCRTRTILWFPFSDQLKEINCLEDLRLLRVLDAAHIQLECIEFPFAPT